MLILIPLFPFMLLGVAEQIPFFIAFPNFPRGRMENSMTTCQDHTLLSAPQVK